MNNSIFFRTHAVPLAAICALLLLNACETIPFLPLHSAEDVNFDAWQVEFASSKTNPSFSFGNWTAKGFSAPLPALALKNAPPVQEFQFVLESPDAPPTLIQAQRGALFGHWEGVVWNNSDPYSCWPGPDFVSGQGWLTLRPGLRAQFWAGGKPWSLEFVPGGRSSASDWGLLTSSWQSLRIVHLNSHIHRNGIYLQFRHGFRVLGAIEISPSFATVYLSRDTPHALRHAIAATCATLIAASPPHP